MMNVGGDIQPQNPVQEKPSGGTSLDLGADAAVTSSPTQGGPQGIIELMEARNEAEQLAESQQLEGSEEDNTFLAMREGARRPRGEVKKKTLKKDRAKLAVKKKEMKKEPKNPDTAAKKFAKKRPQLVKERLLEFFDDLDKKKGRLNKAQLEDAVKQFCKSMEDPEFKIQLLTFLEECTNDPGLLELINDLKKDFTISAGQFEAEQVGRDISSRKAVCSLYSPLMDDNIVARYQGKIEKGSIGRKLEIIALDIIDHHSEKSAAQIRDILLTCFNKNEDEVMKFSTFFNSYVGRTFDEERGSMDRKKCSAIIGAQKKINADRNTSLFMKTGVDHRITPFKNTLLASQVKSSRSLKGRSMGGGK